MKINNDDRRHIAIGAAVMGVALLLGIVLARVAPQSAAPVFTAIDAFILPDQSTE